MEECFQKENFVVDFSDQKLNSTMKQIEELYWYYLDNYRPTSFCTPYNFLARFLKSKNIPASLDTVKHYWRRYEKYKKMIPTAGCIIRHEDEILVVRVQNSIVFSMPKGKFEASDGDLKTTAIRETLEETGVDLSTADIYEGPNILKTQFFVYDMPVKQTTFNGYNTNEITEVAWVKMDEVINRTDMYSKQTQQVVEYLSGGPSIVL